MNHFSMGLWCATKNGFYMTTGGDQLSGWTETAPQHFPKPDLHQKRCHGYCLLLCCPSDPLKLSESQWNHYIWEIHSASQDAPSTATPAGGTGQQKGSNSSQQQHLTARHTIKASKVEQIGSYILPHPPDSPDLLPYFFFKNLNLLQRKCFHNQENTENALQEFIKSWSMDFYVIGINKLISCWQKCVDCNGSYFN